VVAACADSGLPACGLDRDTDWSAQPLPSVLVDCSGPAGFGYSLERCLRHRLPLVACASGLDEGQERALADLARAVAVVRAVNLSVGHWLQNRLLTVAGQLRDRLPVPPTAAVLERHPVTKRDRPSATARRLAQTWADVTGVPVADVASARSGLPVSDHIVEVTLDQECVTLIHTVRDLRAAAFGALLAARWAWRAPAGLLTIDRLFDRTFLGSHDD
jgi:4-hydroxy-tetrahydrodipicolinate reductase